MQQRKFPLAAIALATFGFLSGCGGGGGGGEVNAATPAAAGSSPADAALSSTPGSVAIGEVVPYFQSWNGSLMDAKNAAGMDSAVLAFAITNGSCAFEPTLLGKLPDARNYVAAGGRLSISFGGQAGVYAEIACKDDNQLFTMMEKLMLDSGTRQFDFDVEGQQLLNVEGTARRTRVLARLQAKYPDLAISFTLPGWFQGVDANSMNLLNTTKAAGVRIDMVNVMAMSFGADNVRTMVSPSTMAQAVIMTLSAAAKQVATIYPNKTPAQVNAMMGVTPMIGKNDDGTTFSLADAQTVANHVKANGIGRISSWSFQRDRAQADSSATDINAFSGVAQSDFQFHKIFKSASGSVPVTAATAAATPLATAACGSSSWILGNQYAAGSVVSYTDGQLYVAKYANPGYVPTVSTYYWAPYSCAAAPA